MPKEKEERDKMRKIRLIGILLCTFVLFFLQGKMQTMAAEYTFTVRIYAGNQGTIMDMSDLNVVSKNPAQVQITKDASKIVITGLSYEDRVTYQAQKSVRVPDTSKYYVRGFRLSGRDNGTIAKYASFVVTESQDYVVAYGIKGDVTQYTVTYKDEQGNTLAPSQTYYGNVGDLPVMAYTYLDGHIPSARNISRELKADSSKNLFEFIYTLRPGTETGNPPAENPQAVKPQENPEAQANPSGQQGAGAGGIGNEAAANIAGAANGADAANITNAANPGNEENALNEPEVNESNSETEIQEPEVPRASNPDTEIVDEKVPLSGRVTENGMLAPMVIGAISALVLAVLIILFFWRRRRKKNAVSNKKTKNE